MSDPQTIMIIRHGEKPPVGGDGVNVEGKSDPHSLTPQGWQRAEALAVFFAGDAVRSPFLRPGTLVAPNYGSNADSHRPVETLIPCSRSLALHIDTPEAEGHEEKLAKWLIATPTTPVLVCWEHHHIPALAQALAHLVGVTDLPSNANEWPEDDYSTALIFTPSGSRSYSLTQTSEALLPGDPGDAG